MKRRLVEYIKKIDTLLENTADDIDWGKEKEEHLVQIGFFQHERFIHLVVTMTFALLTVISMGVVVISNYIPAILVTALLLLLLVPYISHYYILENGVQKMYCQYDRMVEKINR